MSGVCVPLVGVLVVYRVNQATRVRVTEGLYAIPRVGEGIYINGAVFKVAEVVHVPESKVGKAVVRCEGAVFFPEHFEPIPKNLEWPS